MAISGSKGGLDRVLIVGSHVPKLQIEDSITWEEVGDD